MCLINRTSVRICFDASLDNIEEYLFRDYQSFLNFLHWLRSRELKSRLKFSLFIAVHKCLGSSFVHFRDCIRHFWVLNRTKQIVLTILRSRWWVYSRNFYRILLIVNLCVVLCLLLIGVLIFDFFFTFKLIIRGNILNSIGVICGFLCWNWNSIISKTFINLKRSWQLII